MPENNLPAPILSIPQYANEPAMAFEAFLIYIETGTNPDSQPDKEAITAELFERRHFVVKEQVLDYWIKRFDWTKRYKYYQAGLHEQLLPKLLKSQAEAKQRRLAVIEDNLDFCLRMRQQIEQMLPKDIEDLSATGRTRLWKNIVELENALLTEQRKEYGEENSFTTNLNIDVILDGLAEKKGYSQDQIEAIREAYIRQVDEERKSLPDPDVIEAEVIRRG